MGEVERVRAFRSLAHEKLDALRAKAFHEVASLPQYSGEPIRVLGRAGWLGVYAEAIDAETVQVIVQGCLRFRWWPFGGHWFADGFRRTSHGSVEAVPDEIMAEYE